MQTIYFASRPKLYDNMALFETIRTMEGFAWPPCKQGAGGYGDASVQQRGLKLQYWDGWNKRRRRKLKHTLTFCERVASCAGMDVPDAGFQVIVSASRRRCVFSSWRRSHSGSTCGLSHSLWWRLRLLAPVAAAAAAMMLWTFAYQRRYYLCNSSSQ